MALQLSPEQVDLIADELAWKLSAIMESAGGGDEEGLLEACKEIEPLRAAIQELRDMRSMADLDLLTRVAGEALGNHRDSAGNALATIHQVRTGRIVEFRSATAETAEEIIERERSEADRTAQQAATAQSVLWAAQYAEDEARAAEGDPRAKEGVAAHKRWAEENRKLDEAG